MRNGYGDGGCSCPSWWSRACTTRTGSWMASVAELWLVAEQDILVLCLSQVKMRIGRRFDGYRLFADGFGTKRVRSKTLHWVEYCCMFGRDAFNVCDKRLVFLSIVGTEGFSEIVFGSWVWSCECKGVCSIACSKTGGGGLGRNGVFALVLCLDNRLPIRGPWFGCFYLIFRMNIDSWSVGVGHILARVKT